MTEVVQPESVVSDPSASGGRLRLLSYNIQTGIATRRFRDYLTHSWRHVLPHPKRLDNLDRIASTIQDFDIVGVQEADGGSLRSGFINLTEYLALQARFPWWYDQTNRDLGKFAQNALGILSRFVPSDIAELRLPGMIPGRGALAVKYGDGDDSLLVMIAHLSLGRRARLRQLAFLAEVMEDARHVVFMGDFNCDTDSLEMNWMQARTSLQAPVSGHGTFPSWRPQRQIDHILVSPSLRVHDVRVIDLALSDHLPIVMEVELPPAVRMRRALNVPVRSVVGA